MSRHLVSSTTTQKAQVMVQYGRFSRSSWTESVRSYFGKTVMGKAIWENPIAARLGENSPNWECLLVHREKGLFLSVYVDDIKFAGKKQNLDPMLKSTQQRSWFGRTNIFPWSCILGMHSTTMWNKQRYCGQLQNHVWIANFRGKNWKIPCSENIRISSWSCDVEGHAQKCVERYCELAITKTQQLYKVSTPCIDDHHFKEEELKSVGELSKVCWQIVLKCLYLARFGRLDIFWSVKKLAWSITKWTKARDKRLCRLISYIHHTCEYKQYCYVVKLPNNAYWGLFHDSNFAGDLDDTKSTSGGTLCVFGSHTFVPISWMCQKQTSVSHSSTESSFLWMQDWGWMVSRTWFMGSDRPQFMETRIRVIKNKETC